MAFLNATVLENLQVGNPADEKRYPSLGLVDAVEASSPFTDFISPSDKKAMQTMSDLRNIQLSAIKDGTVTIAAEPGFNFIPSNKSESAQYTFVPVNIFSGMVVHPAEYKGNSVDANSDIQIRMRKILHAMGLQKEALLQTTLEAIKTQVLDGVTQVSQGEGTFTFGSSLLTISKAAIKDTLFANVSALFDINEVSGNIQYVTNRGGLHQPLMEYLKYGAANEKNLQALGFVDESRYHQSSTVAAGSDVFNGYAFRDGAIGTVSSFLYDFQKRTAFAGKEWTVSDAKMPFLKSRVNIYKNTEATNGKSFVNSDDMLMTHFEEIAFWDRFYIVYPYNSDRANRAGDVVKIKGATS